MTIFEQVSDYKLIKLRFCCETKPLHPGLIYDNFNVIDFLIRTNFLLLCVHESPIDTYICQEYVSSGILRRGIGPLLPLHVLICCKLTFFRARICPL